MAGLGEVLARRSCTFVTLCPKGCHGLEKHWPTSPSLPPPAQEFTVGVINSIEWEWSGECAAAGGGGTGVLRHHLLPGGGSFGLSFPF